MSNRAFTQEVMTDIWPVFASLKRVKDSILQTRDVVKVLYIVEAKL